MRYGLLIVVSGIICAGCATLSYPVKKTESARISSAPSHAARAPVQGATLKDDSASNPLPVRSGIIFGKTDFKGVLKTSYVKLSMVDVGDQGKKYYLYIGDQLGSSLLPAKPVEPGYFFLELPAGIYKIYSISIPLGSTLATEEIDITFTIQPDRVNYIGTLEVVGVGEKVKLGGIPLMIPGFDYYCDVLDEREEAFKEFRSRYPLIRKNILVHLMQNARKSRKFDLVPK